MNTLVWAQLNPVMLREQPIAEGDEPARSGSPRAGKRALVPVFGAAGGRFDGDGIETERTQIARGWRACRFTDVAGEGEAVGDQQPA